MEKKANYTDDIPHTALSPGMCPTHRQWMPTSTTPMKRHGIASKYGELFEGKAMVEERKVLFVKLKQQGIALQWWKRQEKQQARPGTPKIQTCY